MSKRAAEPLRSGRVSKAPRDEYMETAAKAQLGGDPHRSEAAYSRGRTAVSQRNAKRKEKADKKRGKKVDKLLRDLQLAAALFLPTRTPLPQGGEVQEGPGIERLGEADIWTWLDMAGHHRRAHHGLAAGGGAAAQHQGGCGRHEPAGCRLRRQQEAA